MRKTRSKSECLARAALSRRPGLPRPRGGLRDVTPEVTGETRPVEELRKRPMLLLVSPPPSPLPGVGLAPLGHSETDFAGAGDAESFKDSSLGL
mmetsp:Transcript_43611/g.136851  ORF Transcript_43611/g.136851 Transcript_43611/m.136851 type:complete len:94 (+) Transcript_43611:2039-2320(+)